MRDESQHDHLCRTAADACLTDLPVRQDAGVDVAELVKGGSSIHEFDPQALGRPTMSPIKRRR